VNYIWYTLGSALAMFSSEGVPLEQIGLTNQTIDLKSLENVFVHLSTIPTLKRIFFYTDRGHMASWLTTADVRAAFKKHFDDKLVLHSTHSLSPSYRLIKG
jgi:hypothetical protein